MIEIDGSQGEGGGQVLRSALALSIGTAQPVRLSRIRAGRSQPGLRAQHLAAVEAAAEVGSAEVEGATLGAPALTFRPGGVRPGEYAFAVDTAGSMTLVLQTVLPALALAGGPSRVRCEGGTHNPSAPPWEFLARVHFPLLGRMGARVRGALERPGFYPAGGGRFRVDVTPSERLEPLDLTTRGGVTARRARALVSRLPERIAARELAVVEAELGWSEEERSAEVLRSRGPGNVLLLELETEAGGMVFAGFGAKGKPAERVAEEAVEQARRYLAVDAAADEHLADQLLLLLALAGGGRFRTPAPLSLHATTQIDLIPRFLPGVAFTTRDAADGVLEVEVRSA